MTKKQKEKLINRKVNMELNIKNNKIIIDIEDYDLIVNCWIWVNKNRGYPYLMLQFKKNREKCLFHRIIMNAQKGQIIDHINHDTLDNRKCNLRICKHQENIFNQKIHKNNKSGYKGVSFDKKTNKWRAYIKYNYKQINLGRYINPIKASNVYKKAAKIIFGEYAND